MKSRFITLALGLVCCSLGRSFADPPQKQPDAAPASDKAAEADAAEIEEFLAKLKEMRASQTEWTYEQLAEAADTIVIATLVESKVRPDADYRDEEYGRDKDKEDTAVLSVDSRFDVKGVLKGEGVGKQLTVAHLKWGQNIIILTSDVRLARFHARVKVPNSVRVSIEGQVETIGFSGTEFVEEIPEYLLFLKRRPDGLYEPAAGQCRLRDSARIVNLVYLQ